MTDEIRNESPDAEETVELHNMAMLNPHRWLPWYTIFFVDSIQYLSFSIFDKHNLKPFFFKHLERDDVSYVGIMCLIRKKRLEDFLMCMEELEKNMMICGYSDYREFCDKVIEELWND